VRGREITIDSSSSIVYKTDEKLLTAHTRKNNIFTGLISGIWYLFGEKTGTIFVRRIAARSQYQDTVRDLESRFGKSTVKEYEKRLKAAEKVTQQEKNEGNTHRQDVLDANILQAMEEIAVNQETIITDAVSNQPLLHSQRARQLFILLYVDHLELMYEYVGVDPANHERIEQQVQPLVAKKIVELFKIAHPNASPLSEEQIINAFSTRKTVILRKADIDKMAGMPAGGVAFSDAKTSFISNYHHLVEDENELISLISHEYWHLARLIARDQGLPSHYSKLPSRIAAILEEGFTAISEAEAMMDAGIFTGSIQEGLDTYASPEYARAGKTIIDIIIPKVYELAPDQQTAQRAIAMAKLGDFSLMAEIFGDDNEPLLERANYIASDQNERPQYAEWVNFSHYLQTLFGYEVQVTEEWKIEDASGVIRNIDPVNEGVGRDETIILPNGVRIPIADADIQVALPSLPSDWHTIPSENEQVVITRWMWLRINHFSVYSNALSPTENVDNLPNASSGQSLETSQQEQTNYREDFLISWGEIALEHVENGRYKVRTINDSQVEIYQVNGTTYKNGDTIDLSTPSEDLVFKLVGSTSRSSNTRFSFYHDQGAPRFNTIFVLGVDQRLITGEVIAKGEEATLIQMPNGDIAKIAHYNPHTDPPIDFRKDIQDEEQWIRGAHAGGFEDIVPEPKDMLINNQYHFYGYTMGRVGGAISLAQYPYEIPDEVKEAFLSRLKDLQESGFPHRDINIDNILVILEPGENGVRVKKLMLIDPQIAGIGMFFSTKRFRNNTLAGYAANSYDIYPKSVADGWDAFWVELSTDNVTAAKQAFLHHTRILKSFDFDERKEEEGYLTDEQLEQLASENVSLEDVDQSINKNPMETGSIGQLFAVFTGGALLTVLTAPQLSAFLPTKHFSHPTFFHQS
jgi:hypothetical protein